MSFWRRVGARAAVRLVMVGLLLLAALLPLGATTTAADDEPTREQVRAFVQKAVEFARTNGKDAALAAFTAPDSEFHDGQLYVFAYTFGGTVLAHGGDPSLVGRNLMDMTDPNGGVSGPTTSGMPPRRRWAAAR